MKNIASQLKDKEFEEHLSEMQLTLFTDNQLEPKEREEVFKHLSQCKRCRDVLKVASEIREEEQKLKPANNINYKRFIPLAIASSVILTMGILPAMENYPDEVPLKGIMEEKSFLDKTIYYWECRFDEIFGGD